jgi:phosphatidylserine decarboxylase
VKLREKYWVKKQPYALHFMMGGDPLAERFVGGTVYSAGPPIAFSSCQE